jgi:hypothetical protein
MQPSAGEHTVVTLSDTGSHTWNSGCPRCTREPIPTMKLTTPFKKCDGAAREARNRCARSHWLHHLRAEA